MTRLAKLVPLLALLSSGCAVHKSIVPTYRNGMLICPDPRYPVLTVKRDPPDSKYYQEVYTCEKTAKH